MTRQRVLAATITLALYGIFLTGYLHYHPTGIPGLLRVGGRFVSAPDSVPPGVPIIPNEWGYDGQFYYRLALTPFTRTPTAYGIRLDAPAYREQRLLYPLLARALALGRVERIPAAMVVLNVLLLGGLALLGARLAERAGRHPLWGLVVPLGVPFLYSLSRDLAEILEATLIAGALLLRDRHRLAAGLLLALAVLSRETALLLAGAIALTAVIETRGHLGRAMVRVWPEVAPPLIAYAAVQIWLWSVWGTTGSGQGAGSNIGLPFVGVVTALRTARIDHFLEVGYLLIFAVMVARNRRGNPAPGVIGVAWILYAVLLSLTSPSVWDGSAAFFRAATELLFLGSLLLLSSATAGARRMLWSGIGLWVVMAVGVLHAT
jgi:hypothetical protein